MSSEYEKLKSECKNILTHRVLDDLGPMRLDKYLSTLEQIHSRSQGEYLITENRVWINRQIGKSSVKIKINDIIEIFLPDKIESDLVARNIPLDIIFEDDNLLVINKPSGLVVHPAAGHSDDTLVNALMFHTKNLSMKFGEDRPGIVHRLDKETSGLIVVAKNDLTHEGLAKQFKDRSIKRFYEAIVVGCPKNDSGTIQSYLIRHPKDRKKYASCRDEVTHKILTIKMEDSNSQVGKWAVTHYKKISENKNLARLELKLETGRTHQIRVHLSELGNPIVGDSLYGYESKGKVLSNAVFATISRLNRFLLHAKVLGFVHPITKENHYYEQEWSADIIELIREWKL